jgi:hypothetical protein
MLKRVWRPPVKPPAKAPASVAAAVAVQGEYPRAIMAAATAAPNVNEPSAVISGNEKIRKLMNTPSARIARIRPIVQAPMSSVMITPSPLRRSGGRPRRPLG